MLNFRHKKWEVKIQHCPISSKFDMWVHNDVPTLKHVYRLPFSKWPPQYRTNSTLSDFNHITYVGRLWCLIIIYLHMKFRWNRTMLNLWGIVVVILKMATGRNFSISGINSGHHYLPTYQILMSLHFQNGRHNTAKIQDCSISKVAFDLFFKPVVSGRFGRLHSR
jgi:hypothetical protein